MAGDAKRRLVGLDVMRGITMAVMLVVDATGDAYPSIGHAPWDGLHLADFVMPYFLLISGISASISLKVRSGERATTILVRVAWRALRLFLVGLAVQGSLFHDSQAGPVLALDLRSLRIMGILQRIAVVFVIVAAIELYVPANVRSRSEPLLRTESAGLGFWLLPAAAFRWAVALAVAACGAVLTYALRPPATWPGCSPAAALRGNADPEALHRMGCSSVGWLDSLILGVDHVYIRGSNQGLPANFGFDPEGLVTTLSAVFCMFLGLHLGRVWLILAKPRPVISHWLILGALCACLGAALSFGLPFNKRLWSPSYSLFTAGTGTVLYSGLFAACDAAPSSRAAAVFGTALAPFQWLGSNCILFFVFSECCGVLSWLLRVVSWGQPASEHNIVHWFHDQFLWQTCSLGAGCKSGALCGPVEVAYTVVGLVFWVLVCGILHRKQIFWKI